MAASKVATPALEVSIPKINVRQIDLDLVGISPLITHAWDEKAKKQMLDKQMKKAKTAKDAKDPVRDFVNSLHWLTPKPDAPTQADVDAATFGFPCIGFKKAAVSACRFSDGAKMTEARGAFHVDGEFVAIQSAPPRMREDMVRIAMGTADIRFRGEFADWRVTLRISFNEAVMSIEQITNLFNLGGFGVGVGEWRPEKNGSSGRFKVA